MDPTLFELAPQEFEGVIAELGLPQSEADQLRRQYRRQNSMFAGLYGLLDSVAGQDAEQGRVRADMLPMTRPEGMTGIEALLSGNAELAIPGGLLGGAEAAVMGIDAPAAAYQGMIPAEDMAGEALGTAGMAMTGGGAVARPAGSVGMGGRVVNFGEARQERARQSLIERLTRAISDVTSGEHQRRMDAIGLEAHQRGILPLPLGARVSPPQGWDMPGDWSIDGYWVDTINPQRSGYRLINSEGQVYNAPVFDPQIGYSTQNPYLFGGGFRAYAGPSQNTIEYDNLPAPRREVADARTPEEIAAIDAEYRSLFGDELSANRSPTAGAVGLLANESRAQRIARMLREGRGDEITDDMLAALDANDNMELAQLYAAGETGVNMPMDFESRMARADQYFPDIAYHSTGNDFQDFIPSEFRGASFFGSTPKGASAGASASANEGVGSGSTITMPVRVDTSRVEGLGAYGRMDMNEFRDALQDRIYTEAEVDGLMASDLAPRYGDWTYFFDDLTDYDALRRFRDENPDAPVPDGIIAFQPRPRLSYGPGLQSDISGRQFAHYSEGMSERPISEHTKSIGNTGFTMMDESGLALAMTDPSRIRSRFARFDPRLRNSANLLAANASPELGLLAASAPREEDQLDQLRAYLGLLNQ
jgi:hypothetical protein